MDDDGDIELLGQRCHFGLGALTVQSVAGREDDTLQFLVVERRDFQNIQKML